MPKQLKCIDDSCEDQISTGRIIKATKPIHGNLESIKISSKVKIRGKNVDPQNTLWLVEQEGFYGFIDLSFIKENKMSVNDDLSVVDNPYYMNQVVDETEDNDDSTNVVGLFSKEKSIRKNDAPMENDETENFSERNSNLNAETEKLKNNEDIKSVKKSPNEDVSISNLNDETKILNDPMKSNASSNINKEVLNEKSDINRSEVNIPNEKHQPLNLVQKQNDTIINAKENLIEENNISKNDLDSLNVEHVKKGTKPKENIEVGVKEITKLDESMESRKVEKDLKAEENMQLLHNTEHNIKNVETVKKIESPIDNTESLENVQLKLEKNSYHKKVIETQKNVEQNVEKDLKSEKNIESPKNVVEDIKFNDNIESLENVQQKPEKNSSLKEVIETQKNVEQNVEKDLKSEKNIESPKNDNTESLKSVQQKSEKNSELVGNLKKDSNDEEVKHSENIKSYNNDQIKMAKDSKENNVFQEKSIPIKSKDIEINAENDLNKQINRIPSEANKILKPFQDQSEKDEIMKKEILKKSPLNIPKESIKSLKIDNKPNNIPFQQDEKLDQEVEKENMSTNNEENSQLNPNLPQIHNKSKNIILDKSTESNTKSVELENRVKVANYRMDKKESENSIQKEKTKNSESFLPDNDMIKSEKPIIENETMNESEKINKILNKPDHIKNSESESVKLTKDVEIKSLIGDSSDPINSDPWLGNAGKSGLDNDKDMISNVKSPVIKLILKLDLLSQVIIKSITLRLGFDSSSKLSQFTNNWLQMSLENFVSIFSLFFVLFFVVYTPKIFKFNRDWKSEFLRQSQLMRELESKLQSIEEVRHKLTVQNHNFEKVIDEYKQKINEIQEDAAKNKKTVMLEVEKIKKASELNVKNLTMDLANKIKQCEILENDIFNKTTAIDNLEEEKKIMEIQFEDETSQFVKTLSENERELNKMTNSNEQLKHLLQEASSENEQLRIKLQESYQELIDKKESYSQLEKSFEHLKVLEGLNFEEYNEKKAIYLDLTHSKQQLELAEQNIEELKSELSTKCEIVLQLEEAKTEMNKKMKQFEDRKVEAIAQKEAAEMKLNVLSEYFKSKEVEMAKTLGHQVIESTQSLDQVDYLKHRIQILETDNEEMSKTIPRLKCEIKDSQTFAAKCKSDANEEINILFLKCSNLERSLLAEKDENKKLRTKLSHYCGPTPLRNQTSSSNHNKDRPPSRQSGFSESVGTFVPLPFIPFLPQSPTPNNQFSGRNSVNSKKSNNT